MAKYLRYFKYLLYALAGIAVAYCLFHIAYACYFYPRMKPVINWSRADILATRLSQITSADFRALELSIPTIKIELPKSDALSLVERLYETKRFPDWEQSPKLEDLNGRPYTIWVAPAEERSGPNEFTFSVQVPDSGVVIEK